MPSLEISDKLEHFGAYLLLAFLLRLTLHFQKKYLFTYRQIVIITSVVGIIYGLFDELHQMLIPGRFFDWYDLLANTIGIILGLILSEIFIKYGR
ncbi:MAG: VanZ family protein [Bacteroidetes bacterium]|nr:VanZ family protein [Bacteroidota bacterium]